MTLRPSRPIACDTRVCRQRRIGASTATSSCRAQKCLAQYSTNIMTCQSYRLAIRTTAAGVRFRVRRWNFSSLQLLMRQMWTDGSENYLHWFVSVEVVRVETERSEGLHWNYETTEQITNEVIDFIPINHRFKVFNITTARLIMCTVRRRPLRNPTALLKILPNDKNFFTDPPGPVSGPWCRALLPPFQED